MNFKSYTMKPVLKVCIFHSWLNTLRLSTNSISPSQTNAMDILLSLSFGSSGNRAVKSYSSENTYALNSLIKVLEESSKVQTCFQISISTLSLLIILSPFYQHRQMNVSFMSNTVSVTSSNKLIQKVDTFENGLVWRFNFHYCSQY